jgi:hypothetical protein
MLFRSVKEISARPWVGRRRRVEGGMRGDARNPRSGYIKMNNNVVGDALRPSKEACNRLPKNTL